MTPARRGFGATLTVMPTTSPRKPRPVRGTPRAAAGDAATVTDIDDAPPPFEFTVEFDRDGEPETHTFASRPRFTYKRMSEAARAQSLGGAAALLRFEKMIRPALLDTDGTPAKWTPTVDDGQFEAPDGELRDVADLAALLEFDAGSSRRRWAHLMDDDDDLEIEIEAIVAVYEKLVGAATDRPTRRSKSS